VSASSYPDLLESHYLSNWQVAFRSHLWKKGPIHELPSPFRVLVFDRSAEAKAYATICMSQPEDESKLEVHLFARAEGEDHEELVELLTVVAHFHRTGAPLDLGHTVNFGRAWLPGSSCTHGLLSLPYLDGPSLEWMETPRVRFLWLMPVTQQEVEFKKRHGLEALEDRFEGTGFDYLDPLRKSVV
jgi:Suppressor of fused protein (SUFU)